MMNEKELKKLVRHLKKEYIEALQRGNSKIQDNIVNQLLNLELALKEESFKKNIKEINLNDEIEFEYEDDKVYRQEIIVKSFKNKIREISNKYKDTTKTPASERQAETIMAGLRDRIGMDITKEQIDFIKNLNNNQASQLIKILSHISFYNQRAMLSQALSSLKYREDFNEILEEVKNNIHKREWFELNKELLAMSYELQEPTDAQIRRIADVSRYLETHETLLSEYGINVQDFEYRQDDKLYYTFNWNLLKDVIKTKFNRESAYNFIQTYDYITNYYEGNKLDKDQMNTLRRLYIQLGDYECTRLNYLSTISKSNFDAICKDLEYQIKFNKVANNEATKKFREKMNLGRFSSEESRIASGSAKLKREQEETRDLVRFVYTLYSAVGQDIPEEMNDILPYFIERGSIQSANIDEQHYKEFRQMVFEQRDIIKELNPKFDWASFITQQPNHILKLLGLDILM